MWYAITHHSGGRDASIPVGSSRPRITISASLVKGSSILAALAAAGWSGLSVQPAPFPPVPEPVTPPATMGIPDGLPEPVARFYQVTYGARVPMLTSAVISGRGKMRIGGIAFPARFRFIHEARHAFRAYFELTAFGIPLLWANEHYGGEKFRQELPFGVTEGEPKVDHSAAVRMWAEWATWLPAMLLTDPQVRWEPLDEHAAVLVVPYADGYEHLVVRFDETSGRLQYVEGMKYKHPSDTTKTLWVNATWFGDRPWATFDIENKVYNVAVDTSLAAQGPNPR